MTDFLRNLDNISIVMSDSVSQTAPIRNVQEGPATLMFAFLDNGDNSTEEVFLKLYDNIAPTLGTTEPDFVFPVQISSKDDGGMVPIAINPPNGIKFDNGVSYACAKEAGVLTTTAPTAVLKLTLVFKR